MPLPSGVRTFIRLEEKELRFLRTLQRLMEKKSKRRVRPPLQGVIQAIILDYKRMLEFASSPDFLEAYEYIKSKRRKTSPLVE
jgi:hypothetical protein